MHKKVKEKKYKLMKYKSVSKSHAYGYSLINQNTINGIFFFQGFIKLNLKSKQFMYFYLKTAGKKSPPPKKKEYKNITPLCFYYFIECRAFVLVPSTLIDERCSTNVNTYTFGNFIIKIDVDLLKRFSIFVKKINSPII